MTRSPRLALIAAIAAALTGVGPAAADDVQVNTYTSGSQTVPSIAMDPDGDFVVAWYNYGSDYKDPALEGIRAQRFSANGSAAGGEFQVNTFTTDFQADPSVAMEPDGDFVVVWRNVFLGETSSQWDILGRRYAADGSALGDFQADTYTTAFPIRPTVATDADGDFVVVWDLQVNYSQGNIHGRRFASDGSALGAEFQVNTTTSNRQRLSRVAMDADGDFVVVWVSPFSAGTDTSNWSIQAQRYASDGSAAGGEFQVNTTTPGFQTLPSVAMAANGDFVVAWQGPGSGTDTDNYSITAQRYAADGLPVGDEFQVNSYTTDGQFGPSVAMDAAGDFIVVWYSLGSSGTDTDSRSVQAQRFAADGAAAGEQFQVNTYTTDVQWHSAVALDDTGSFVAAWESYGSSGTDASEFSIQSTPPSALIFADGFESGDTSSWSKKTTP